MRIFRNWITVIVVLALVVWAGVYLAKNPLNLFNQTDLKTTLVGDPDETVIYTVPADLVVNAGEPFDVAINVTAGVQIDAVMIGVVSDTVTGVSSVFHDNYDSVAQQENHFAAVIDENPGVSFDLATLSLVSDTVGQTSVDFDIYVSVNNTQQHDVVTLNLDVQEVHGAAELPLAVIVASTASAVVADEITFDASTSVPVAGVDDALTYAWTLTTPEGSTAVLSATDEVEVNFTADVIGEYEVELVVTQGELVSGVAAVGVTVTDEPVIEAPPACGDGNLDEDEGEECDDGNNDDGDGCNADCTDPLPGSVCGNGSQEPGEACDGTEDCTDECTLVEDVVPPTVAIVQGVAGLPYGFDATGLVPGASIISATIGIAGLSFDPVTQTFAIGLAPPPGIYTGTLLLSNGETYEITWEILPVDLFIAPEGISTSLLITTLVADVLSGVLTITGDKYYDVVYVINAVLLANP